MREASVEVIAELKDRLKIINEDHSAQRKLNATIADLREKNATLKGKLQSRDTEFSGIERQFKEIKQELQNCRDQLAVTSDELSKALSVPREDPLLRTQLQDLQSSYSIIKDQADSSASETESLRAGLHKQEKLTLLAQQEASKLQDKLRQSEAKVSAFSAQKDAYVRQVKEESDMLRLQMERDVRARRAEDEARNNDNVSGLRRQITEADNKLAQTKQKLHDMEKMSSSKEAEAHRLSTNISAVATELGCLQEKYRIMEQNRDSMVNELSISKEQLIRYMEQAGECSAQAEENALEFAKRSKEIDDGIEKSGKVAEVEVERFEALVLMLQKKNEDSEIVNSNVARYLHSIGLLKPGLTFTEWAVRLPGEQFQQDERNLDPSRLSFIGEPFGVSALIRESYAYGSRNECGTSTVSSNNKEAPLVVPEDNSERLACEYVSHDANGSSALLDDDRRKALPENESSLLTSYSKSSSKSMSPVNHKHEHQLNTSSLELTSTSRTLSNIPQPFPATEATPRSYLRASDSFHDSNIRLGGIKRLEGTASSVVPESQEELTKEQIPNFARPTRRVAERRHSMAEGNRTITRTEVTGYSILTSKTYVDTPAARHNGMGSLSFGDVATDLKSVDLDTDSSSVMSDPPDGVENVDFTEFMDSCDGRDREDPVILRFSDKKAYADSMVSHPVLSPKPNSSRVRTGPPVRPEEIKPPKSILKRTNTMIPTNDTAVNAQLSGKTLKNTQLSKVQGIHKGTGPKRRSSRTMCGINGRDDATYGSSYNRMVTGSKVLHSSNNFQAHDVPPQLQGPSAANVFAISSSPAMGQPQRNSKKRALSGVGINDSNRPAKLQRLVRH